MPEVVSGTDRGTLCAAVAHEGWPLDLTGAVVDDRGWENIVLATRDGWILRFPRSAVVPFEREMAVLRRLRDRLPVAIPDVAWTGARVRVAAYRKIVGAAFDPQSYQSAAARDRDRVAASLADFLAAMHTALTRDETCRLRVPPVDHSGIYEAVTSRLGLLPADHQPAVARLAAAYAATWVAGTVPGPGVVLHNDFHPLNMAFSAPVGRLTGIWDFSCVLIDKPTFDLRYFDRGPHDLLERLALAYTQRTGWPVDLNAAAVANRMEDVHDAVLTGRMELFHAALTRWGRSRIRL